MDTTEALGYLKGLLDGLDLDENKKETKVFKAIVSVLDNLNEDVLEEIVYDDDFSDVDDEDYEDYEITCPACGAEFTVDEDTVLEGNFECPSCGETLNFEFEEDDTEE